MRSAVAELPLHGAKWIGGLASSYLAAGWIWCIEMVVSSAMVLCLGMQLWLFFFFLPQGGSGLGDILVENKFYLIVYNNNLGRKGVFSNHGLDGWPCSRIHSSSHPRGFPCT